MNEKALHIYKSTFLVELTREKSIEHTYGFVINEGTETEPKLIHYIHGDVTTEDISCVRMIFNYYHNENYMERSVSEKFIPKTFTYDSKNNVSVGELPVNVTGEEICVWM